MKKSKHFIFFCKKTTLKWVWIIFFILCFNHLIYSQLENNVKNKIGILNFFKNRNFEINKNFLNGNTKIVKNNFTISFLIGSRIISNNQNDLWILNTPLFEINGDIYVSKKIIFEILKSYQNYNKKISPINSKAKKSKIDFIVIDPGHGGKDPGNVHNNFIEKKINLKFSLQLVKALKSYYTNKKIYLTRNTDKWLNLNNRTKKAIQLTKKGLKGIYISIHCNASPNLEAKGLETFFYASKEQWLAKDSRIKILKPLIKGMPKKNSNIFKILLKMQDINISKESYILAHFIHHNLYKKIKKFTLDRGIKAHRYFVIKNINLPSILVELGFLSNKDESKVLNQGHYQWKLINGFLLGLEKFINTYENNNGYIDLTKIK